MDAVDDVRERLMTARADAAEAAWAAYNARMAKPSYHTKSGMPSKYDGTHPNRGRYDWFAKLEHKLECLPPTLVCYVQTPMDNVGEYAVWMHFEAPMHFQTVKKILNKQGTNVQYVSTTTMKEIEEQRDNPVNETHY